MQFGNYDTPEMEEYPEARAYINMYNMMTSTGGGLSWGDIQGMPYFDFQVLIVCANAHSAHLEIESAQKRAGNSKRGSSVEVIFNKNAYIGKGEDS